VAGIVPDTLQGSLDLLRIAFQYLEQMGLVENQEPVMPSRPFNLGESEGYFAPCSGRRIRLGHIGCDI